MNVLNVTWFGGVGGIENLILSIAKDKTIHNEVCFFAKGGLIAEELQKMKVPIYYMEAKHGYSLSVFPKFLKILRDKDFDIVNVHNGPLALVFTVMAKIIKGNFKIVLTEHDDISSKSKKEIYFYRLLKYFVNHFVAVSNYVKASMVKIYRVPESKITVIYNGIDLSKFRRMAHKYNSTFQICYVGRLVPKKGVELLLKAFDIFRRDSELSAADAKLVIVGDGPEKGRLENLTKELGITGIVEFTGYRRDISELLQQADVFVYPSLYEEAFGISVVEAMAVGVPPIVFKKGGLIEVVDNEQNGFHAADTNEVSLSEEIEKAYRLFKENKLEEYSRSSIEKAQCFSINNTINSLKSYYNSLLSEVH